MKKILLTLFILSGSFAFAQGWWGSEKVRGNGNITTETRSVGNFDSVNVGGFFEVILVDGKEGKLTIEGEENILPYIITEVKRGKLKIKVKDNVNIKTRRKLTVTVPFQSIEAISLGGSGNVISEKTIESDKVSFSIGGSGNIKAKVAANLVTTSIGGSGNIRLKGEADRVKCSIAGSGNIKAYDLKANSLKVNVAGSGDIYVSVKEKIKANVVGSGNIYYKGNPKYVDTNALGSGDVIKKD